jgi:hypothetical protein
MFDKKYSNYNEMKDVEPIEKMAGAIVEGCQGDFLTRFNRGV